MKRMIKNYLPIVISALCLFLLAACMAPIKDSMINSKDEHVLGRAMYDGVVYDVPDDTTACYFDEDQVFEDAVSISSDQTPTSDLECSVPGDTIQFTIFDGTLILIVDGSQHILN